MRALPVALLLLTMPVLADDCTSWPAWQDFAKRFISVDGRVVDPSSPRQITTSEGQAYAAFFALAGNDPARFAQLLAWTRDNLAASDLTARLPAWLWGRRDDGQWGVLDANAASDADVWLAYSLIEAGTRWQRPEWAATGRLLAQRIVREESAELPGLGRTLLPGPQGFASQPGQWRLNPSYLAWPVIDGLAAAEPAWLPLAASSRTALLASVKTGYAPDWLGWNHAGAAPDPQHGDLGSYDAIRVYLWAGMLHPASPRRQALLTRLAPMARRTAADGAPPEKIRTASSQAEGQGPAGFSAVLAVLLTARNERQAADSQWLRRDALWPQARDNYYDQVLDLFAQGWREGRYRFAANGRLQWPQEGACLPPP